MSKYLPAISSKGAPRSTSQRLLTFLSDMRWSNSQGPTTLSSIRSSCTSTSSMRKFWTPAAQGRLDANIRQWPVPWFLCFHWPHYKIKSQLRNSISEERKSAPISLTSRESISCALNELAKWTGFSMSRCEYWLWLFLCIFNQNQPGMSNYVILKSWKRLIILEADFMMKVRLVCKFAIQLKLENLLAKGSQIGWKSTKRNFKS